ncbi:hypothetical protein J2X65_001681 [Ancylobacter sp. 3268]|nr:hypothetical protein [Ancylobacter sp. 3268]MDR6952326.1 hypothetical protein [Ancylobacter sp. 3268]
MEETPQEAARRIVRAGELAVLGLFALGSGAAVAILLLRFVAWLIMGGTL